MAMTFFERRSNDSEMTFVDHLEALRWHIMRAVIAIMVAAVVIFLNIDWVFDNVVMGPIRNNFVLPGVV